MAEPDSPPPKPAVPEGEDEPPSIRPLTRRNYKRSEATERQITASARLDAKALITRAQQREKTATDYLSPEALVYFIRRADAAGDRQTRDALFREVIERCTVFFCGQFRGCSKEEREDLQGAVMTRLVEDILDPGDRADFMQVRFWSYLQRRAIDAFRSAFRHASDIESLEAGFSGEGGSEGQTNLDRLADERLSPEDLVMLSEGLAALPLRLRQVFVLRHAVGLKIGSDNPADDAPNELTLARHFNCSGRTIRNRLKEAERLLARFRENGNDEPK